MAAGRSIYHGLVHPESLGKIHRATPTPHRLLHRPSTAASATARPRTFTPPAINSSTAARSCTKVVLSCQ
ncbi:hypothetical protein TPAR_04066 [Tolypocladium paradoxum]|uniref:Uncharacterized protein n=1 Tax=Tolypocladium paradoxum TaxID=94208 RepID=A0A2S4KZY3_9HYPO|nr:hypothetical protein TPAR_04066 [Tolypocladium paradoxum]